MITQREFAGRLAPILGLTFEATRAFLKRANKSGYLSPVEISRLASFYDENQLEQAKAVFAQTRKRKVKTTTATACDATIESPVGAAAANADESPAENVVAPTADVEDDDAEDAREDDFIAVVPADDDDADDELIDAPLKNTVEGREEPAFQASETTPRQTVLSSNVVAPTPAQKNFLPMTITPEFAAIPQVLRNLKRWLCWRLIPAEPKNKKVPMTPKNGKLVNADVKKSENWLTFDEAISYFNRGLCSGIGFALTNTPPKVCCVDVDHCIADGELNEVARDVINLCGNSFVEKSQSGSGIHVWFIDDDFVGGRKKDPVEVYAADRYIAMTGCRVQSSADDLLTVNGACKLVIGKYIGEREGNLFSEKPARAAVDTNDTATLETLSDNDRQLVKYFRSDKCGERDRNLFDLFNGNIPAYFKNTGKGEIDDSVADCDLMLKILFYVGGEGSNDTIGRRALKIFGQSELAKREKWNQREDYRQRTLNAAFAIWNQNGRNAMKPSTSFTGDRKAAQIDILRLELAKVDREIDDFHEEIKAAVESLKNVETFPREIVFSDEILKAVAFAKLSDKQTYTKFRADVKKWKDSHKDSDFAVNDWLAAVKEHVSFVEDRKTALYTRHNGIQAQIDSLMFVAANDDLLAGIVIPKGYSLSEAGVEKLAGESIIPVCSRPVVVTGSIFDTDRKIFQVALAYKTRAGKWKHITPTDNATVSNARSLVELANQNLPVTSSNASLLVDFIAAFRDQNEERLPHYKIVPRCGWHKFGEVNHFIDPRRKCVIEESGRKIAVKVDKTRSEFTTHLRCVGDLEKWREVYSLAKKSIVARFMVAAAVAPPLLEILGERNFLSYVYAPSRAGKTTALTLAASAVGSVKLIRSFDGTKNGLAAAAADVCDFPFLVDEKQVADSRLQESFSALIYALANGVGRTRLKKDSTLMKVQNWRTIAIMTGETPMIEDNALSGSYTRQLPLAAPREILPADVCKVIRETVADNYGLVFPLVVDRIVAEGKAKLKKTYDSLVGAITTSCPDILPEYCRYTALLMLADVILNTVLGEDFLEAIKSVSKDAGTLVQMIPTQIEISETEREKKFVMKIFSEYQNQFVSSNNVDYSKIPRVYGKLNDADGYCYICAGVLNDFCKREGYNCRKLVSDLVEAKFFVPSDRIKEGCKRPLATVQKKILQINHTCYRVPRVFIQ